MSLNIYSTKYEPFYCKTFLHFSFNLKIPSSQNFGDFSAKNSLRCFFFMPSKEFKFLPLRLFCNDPNKWKSDGVISSEYGGWGNTSQPSYKIFGWVAKETWGLVLFWWKTTPFLSPILGVFLELLPLILLVVSSTFQNQLTS